MSKITIAKTTERYLEATEATEELEPPALGFIKPSEYSTGTVKGLNALIKQNNTLLYAIIQQGREITALTTKITDISNQLKELGKREAVPANLEEAIEGLNKRIETFKVSGKEPIQVKHGPIYAYENPNEIFRKQFAKEKK